MDEMKQIYCDKCKREYRVPFSADSKYFCPYCHTCNTGRQALLFQYPDSAGQDIKYGTLLDAISVSPDGKLYYWNKSRPEVTTVGADIDQQPEEKRIFDIPTLSAGGVSDIQRGVSYFSTRHRRKKMIRECVSYVDSMEFIKKIIRNGKEDMAAARITRITSITERSGRMIVRCYLQYPSRPEFRIDLNILKSIQEYEVLKQILTDYMHNTKDLDEGSEASFRRDKLLKVSLLIMVIGVVMFLTGLTGVIIFGMKPDPGISTGIAGAIGIAGVFTGCIGAGIRYKYRK